MDKSIVKKLKNKIKFLYLWIWELFQRKLGMRPPLRYYLLTIKGLQRNKTNKQILRLLKEAVNNYPNNNKLHTELALICMKFENWKEANSHWSIVLDSTKGKPDPAIFSEFGRSLRREGKLEDGKRILERGLSIYPNDVNVLFERAEIARRQREWEISIKYLQTIFETCQKVPPARFYLRMGFSYQKLQELNKADVILKLGIDEYPSSIRLMTEYVMVAIFQRDWNKAKKRLEKLIKKFGNRAPIEESVKLAVVNQILGYADKAAELYSTVFEERAKEIQTKQYKKYLKVILFDNGESRIEFYKKLYSTNTVVITFDSINISWNEVPFGFNFLLKENVDIIAVRRRRKDSYQQDLSIADFYESVNVLTSYYERKVAYGFSLGAYSALYFGSSINCDILSLSPRNSAHPMHGEKLAAGYEFNHDLSHKVNSSITPVIAFDPKNEIDKEYIETELKRSYPNGLFLEFPYAGHRIAPFFLQIGILKDIVQRVINGEEIPNYKKISRNNSHQYLRVLGNACLRRNKIRWAFDLGERAVNIAPDDAQSNILKIRALIRLEKYDMAIETAELANQLITNNETLHLLLINLYIQKKYNSKAKVLIENGIKKFGKSVGLMEANQLIKKTEI